MSAVRGLIDSARRFVVSVMGEPSWQSYGQMGGVLSFPRPSRHSTKTFNAKIGAVNYRLVLHMPEGTHPPSYDGITASSGQRVPWIVEPLTAGSVQLFAPMG